MGAEPRGRHAKAGVADRVGDPAAVRGAEEDREAATGVDGAAPAVAEAEPFSWGNVVKKFWEAAEGRFVLVELVADRAAVAVDGVIPAPQDPVVGGQPVVVELVGAVADPLTAASRSPPAARSTAARSPARSHRRERRSAAAPAAAADRRSWPAAAARPHAAGTADMMPFPVVQAGGRGVLVDRTPAAARPRPVRSRAWPGPGRRRCASTPAAVGGGRDLGLHGLAASTSTCGRSAAHSAASSRDPGVLVGATWPAAHRSARGRSRCRDAQVATRPSRFSAPSRSSSSISSAKRARPLLSPWVSDATRKPPLRPLAPAPRWRPRSAPHRGRARALASMPPTTR